MLFRSEGLGPGDGLQERYVINSTPALTPIDFGEVSINVDTAWFAAHGATPPTAFEDLAKAEHKDRFVAINPSTSSTGLAFLLATVAHFRGEAPCRALRGRCT